MEFPEQIAIGITFFYFAYLAIFGLLQIIASRHHRSDLSPLGNLRPVWGYLLGSTLLALAYVWFFGTRGEEIFSPGPASSEFAFFLGLALLAALLTSSILAHLLPSTSQRSKEIPGVR